MKQGTYTLKVIPPINHEDSLSLLSTYLGGTQLPQEAIIFELHRDTLFSGFKVLREQAPEQEWTGNSSISGMLVKDDNSNSEGSRLLTGLRKNAGTPMAEAQVFLTDPVSKEVKFSKLTDAEGKFSFKNIASRKYGFLVEYQGETFEMAEAIDLDAGNPSVEVTAVVSESGVSGTVEQVLAVNEDIKDSFLLYPNPVQDKLQLKITGLSSGALEIHIFDRQGKMLLTKQMEVIGDRLEEEIDLSELPRGLYLISVKQDNYLIFSKFMKQ